MGLLSYLFYPWSLILQVLAVVHWIRRRPDGFWIYVILFLGPIGALVYLFAEALPDVMAGGQMFRGSGRRRRIAQLEIEVRDNPSTANYEEMGDLLMDQGKIVEARAAFDKAIGTRTDAQDAMYRRGLCTLRLGDAAGAIPDLERVVLKEPAYDFHRALGILAHALALSGETKKAEALFEQATQASTLSETYLNYASLLASQGRTAEARAWAQKVLDKKVTMPRYLKRRERVWFQSADELMKRMPA